MQNSETQTTSPEGRESEFKPYSGGEETHSAGTLLVVAYLVMWALLLGFVFSTFRRQSKLDARLDDLEAALGKKGAKVPAER